MTRLTKGRAGRLGALGLVLGLATMGLVLPAALVRSQGQPPDYAPENTAWNGLSGLLELAASEGVRLLAPRTLDLSAVRPSDGLLVVFPSTSPPRADIASFVRQGGRVAIADDYGATESLLASFQVTRHELAPDDRDVRLRGNRNVLVAEPRASHPLTAGVDAVVVNHPRTLRHPELEPVLALAGDARAIVLAGSVGRGRLVAISDPSALINNMIELRGNQRFARNLLRYLAQGGGRVWLVAGDAALVGRFGSADARDPLESLRAGLSRMARIELPVGALRWLSAIVAVGLLAVAWTSLPRREQIVRAIRPRPLETYAGDVGQLRLALRADADGDLLAPLLRYRQELEHRACALLALPERRPPHELMQACIARGMRGEDVAAAKALLEELGALALAADGPAPRPRVSARRFHAALAAGERMLSTLERLHARTGS